MHVYTKWDVACERSRGEEHASLGIRGDLLITNGLRFGMLKVSLIIKGLRGRIYAGIYGQECWQTTGGAAKSGILPREIFKRLHQENRARPAVALLFASVSIISCLSSYSSFSVLGRWGMGEGERWLRGRPTSHPSELGWGTRAFRVGHGWATRLLRWKCAAERGDGDAKGVDIGVAEGDCDLGRAVLLDSLPLGHVRSGRIFG